MDKTPATYSRIINPARYCEMLSHGHRYLAPADTALINFIHREMRRVKGCRKIVELGCGPGRFTRRLVEHESTNYTDFIAVDHDSEFIAYAQEQQGNNSLATPRYVVADAITFDPGAPANIFFSQGMHHHIPKGAPTAMYLANVFKHLNPGGCYIVSDEFLAQDANTQRERKTVRWHCHIIYWALRDGNYELAVEEAKTMIDDLAIPGTKSLEQIDLILRYAAKVEHTNHVYDFGIMETHYVDFLIAKLPELAQSVPSGTPTLDLSRGDHKISYKLFEEEVKNVGFVIKSTETFGPLYLFGGFSIYLLRKPR